MDSLQHIQAEVHAAVEKGQPIQIVGGGSKDFIGYRPGTDLRVVNLTDHQGVIDYRPEELMLRVKAGTSLAAVNALLSENNQMLGFEPPDFGGSTLGGVVATGISGSRRPYAGSVRDHVLGVGLVLATGDYA